MSSLDCLIIVVVNERGYTDERANGRVQARGDCGVQPSRANPLVRVAPAPAGGEAASLATDVGRRPATADALSALVKLCPVARAEP